MVALLACATILHSLYVDHRATSTLFQRYGPAYEANPIIRQVGPDAYFGVLYLAVSTTVCPAERRGEAWPMLLAVAVWGVQTWAISTHEPWRTNVAGPPMLFIRWSLDGSGHR